MKTLLSSLVACAFVTSMIGGSSAQGQSAVLSEFYGQGVHAYYAGRTTEAYDLLSLAINNGIDDPRAYYFRGIVAHNSGRPYEAESDWQLGADLEASGKGSRYIGRSLSRYQGAGRLKLEEIRQKSKLQYLAESAARSRQRYGEIGAAPGVTSPAPAATQPRAGVTPPPAPPIADSDPFADDLGTPKVENEDALADAMNDPMIDSGAPAAGDSPAGAPASDPFSTGGDSGADPFGGGGAMDSDPFGGGGAGADPFGDDPFGS
ncbi:hypothetical protein K227x_02810 [Rubripirellula lacrimiformis]|uniref:Tetratricopeptide repeat protein n=1 Tax=Rubripirellula lacrimiformis TaxID=1930273 RepID=A0A517N464_9BACT|nr:hypothetical protein [Rubripirellula lacrimiformis]QDT01912.1 hypothetical protein K227x_02810 [Rubripirellula lacrimiformis]